LLEVDVRGFSCPIPVLKIQKAIDENPGQELAVLLETGVSKENISRLARSKGYDVVVEEVDDECLLRLIPPTKS
jgi:tRNA 2-thiouridine synthesizing protein A